MYTKIYNSIENFDIKALKRNKTNKFKALNKLGIKNLYDLIYFFPRAYENGAKLKKISQIKDGENVILEGTLLNVQNMFFSNRKMTKALFSDGEDFLELVWFNSPYITRSLENNMEIRVTGKVKRSKFLQIVNPSYLKLNSKNRFSNVNLEDKLESIYPLTSTIKQKEMQKILEEALNKYLFLFEENLPRDFIVHNKLMDRKEALINIHFPKSKEKFLEAKRRLIFEEALILEMKILKNRYNENLKNSNMYFLDDKKDLVKKYISNLSFELTNSQKKVITDIYRELNNGKIINRLIQGDVGSGKTVVALILLLYMAENNYQGVIMAPTEILATQHYLEVVKEFEKLDIKVELLTSSVKNKKRKEIVEKLLSGEIDIVIGTHSLIEDDIKFKKLGLIVIDEQHKFGVEQRNKIRDKGIYSNLIVMSATPIPRSLALTVYGDLDISVISQMPLGRKSIKTKWIKNDSELKSMYNFIEEKIIEGRQVYVVSPLIEKSDKLNLASAMESYEDYKKIFPNRTIALIHGKLKNKEKEDIMESFKNGEIDILISTTVVEVGVNVPNSTIIVILSAERFGLSSLHQLRGRVGRGNYQSYCFLVSNTENEISQKRLKIMEETTDGFKIAEEDLKIRDTGEIFGMRQSGLSEFRLLDIVKNIKEISIAKEYSNEYLLKNKGVIYDQNLFIDVCEIY